ncbi:MAG TPA: glycosyltransferase [Puia sp.]|nr:glycosyltransferase [Puia sp.]
MLSIVICSVNPGYLADVTENIRLTIGIEFELLVWDNRQAKNGLCEVYNRMAGKARFPYICFLHEDILFTTKDWGLALTELFKSKPRAGVIGIAGGKYKSRTYSGWYTGQTDLDFINITHRIGGRDIKMTQPTTGSPGEHQVVCVDGVLIGCTRQAWEAVRFDEKVLKGFHFYDIDFSLRAAQKYEVWVTMNIDLIHITKGGDYGDNWVKEAIHYHKNRKGSLPRYDEALVSEQRVKAVERSVAARWLDWLKVQKISGKNKWEWLTGQQLYKWPSLWYPILKFLLYRPLGLRAIHTRSLKRAHKTTS